MLPYVLKGTSHVIEIMDLKIHLKGNDYGLSEWAQYNHDNLKEKLFWLCVGELHPAEFLRSTVYEK